MCAGGTKVFRTRLLAGQALLVVWLWMIPTTFASTTSNTANTATAPSTGTFASGSANASAALRGIGGNPVWTALKLLVLLAVVIVLIILTIRFLAKRTGLGTTQGDVRVLAARQLAPGKSVQVIETYGKRLVIGIGDGVTVLATLDGQVEEPSDSFADVLTERLESLRSRRAEGASTEH